MEYVRWLEDDHRHMSELRTGLQAHLSENDLRIVVDGYISHYDEIFQLKGVAAKSDVFHLITGMWGSQAERCFLWMGGFRPSDLIKVYIYITKFLSLWIGLIISKPHFNDKWYTAMVVLYELFFSKNIQK